MVMVVAIVNWHGSGQEYTAVLENETSQLGSNSTLAVYFVAIRGDALGHRMAANQSLPQHEY